MEHTQKEANYNLFDGKVAQEVYFTVSMILSALATLAIAVFTYQGLTPVFASLWLGFFGVGMTTVSVLARKSESPYAQIALMAGLIGLGYGLMFVTSGFLG